jgi:hypothetical protein
MAEKLSEEQKAELISQLRDIQGFAAIYIPKWIIFLLIFISSVSLIIFIYYKFIKKTPRRVLTLYEITIEKLKNFDYGLSSKKFYLEYSELIKIYMEQRLQIAVMDKTAEEIKPILLGNTKIATANATTLSQIFARADLAKFARREFNLEERSQDIQLSIMVINNIEDLLRKEEEHRLELEKQKVMSV